MYQLQPNTIDHIEEASFEIAKQVSDYFKTWRAGLVYIPRSALRAMGRRYLTLRDRDDLSMAEVFEFGRLYAFFALVYGANGETVTAAEIAVDFCNLINTSPPPPAYVSFPVFKE